MEEQGQGRGEQILLRIGAVCAILGTILSVGAGAGFRNLTNTAGTEAVLQYLAARPHWYWPAVQLSFILGAVLWVGALIALASSLPRGAAGALGRLGAASIIVGAALHIVDSSISGFALPALANAWATASVPEQQRLLQIGNTLLPILGGLWWSVISYFHGLPFVLLGLAAIRSRDYPAWLGWIGVLGGLGSFVVGVLMFLGASFLPAGLFILFALVVSVWMLAMGALMWRRAGGQPEGERPIAQRVPGTVPPVRARGGGL